MPAKVESFEALELVRDELIRFKQRSTDGMGELAGEIRRVLDWIEHDRPAYWKMRVSKAFDAVGEAKANLSRCLMYPLNDETPSCAEEKAELKKAQAYLAHCEEKQRRVREWVRVLRHEMHEYEGRMSQLKSLVEIDTPRTIALIERQTEALERYLSGTPAAPLPKAEPVEAEEPKSEEESA
ncbi:hypothetical protein MalM25_30280 [Planctomycetes bacterium MalM25]|nr:hypothetical protein MalM25_30280 [Planctomycetes bacterium MalM25]